MVHSTPSQLYIDTIPHVNILKIEVVLWCQRLGPSPLKKKKKRKRRCQNKGFLNTLNSAPLSGLHYISSQQLGTVSFLPLSCCPCTLPEKIHRAEGLCSSPLLPAASVTSGGGTNTAEIRVQSVTVWLLHPSTFLVLGFHDSGSLRVFSALKFVKPNATDQIHRDVRSSRP